MDALVPRGGPDRSNSCPAAIDRAFQENYCNGRVRDSSNELINCNYMICLDFIAEPKNAEAVKACTVAVQHPGSPAQQRGISEQDARHVDDVAGDLGHGLSALHGQLAHGVIGRILIEAARLHQHALGLVHQFAV